MTFLQGDWDDMVAARAREAERPGIGHLSDGDIDGMVAGYLGPFRLRRPMAVFDPRQRCWVLPTLAAWWKRPGAPAVPREELEKLNTTRLNFIVREVFAAAVEDGTLPELTWLRGRELHDLLCRAGLGHLA